MTVKVKFEREYVLNSSPKVLTNMLFTPSGLSEWLCDDVNVNDEIYEFFWDGYGEEARLIQQKPGAKMRWIWLEDESDELSTYFEITFESDPMTKDIILKITDFADEDEVQQASATWDQKVSKLKRVVGSK